MIRYDMPKEIAELQSRIDRRDVYHYGSEDYGLELDTHVTLVPCLENGIDSSLLKPYLKPLSRYKAMLVSLGKFENEKFDVLKIDVISSELFNTNKRICADFSTYTEYTEYHPHVTVAYMKKGMADKYLSDDPIKKGAVVLFPSRFDLSRYVGSRQVNECWT